MGDSAVCPSCGGKDAAVWGGRAGRDILECSSCGLLFFARPIERPYDYQEYYPYLADFDAGRFAWELRIRRPKYVRQLRHIRRLHPDARLLLDIGAGPGYLCAVAAAQGWQAQGVEPSQAARAAGARAYGVRYVELDAVDRSSVDAVTCHHVLEHIDEPPGFLATLRQKLRTGGVLVLHVPNRQPLSFLLRQRLRRGRGDTPCSLYYPVHINGFTTASLTHLVERQAFAVISARNASMWSAYYDPFFLRNYYRNGASIPAATARVLTHALRCAVDVTGNRFDRGDWIVAHCRAI